MTKPDKNKPEPQINDIVEKEIEEEIPEEQEEEIPEEQEEEIPEEQEEEKDQPAIKDNAEWKTALDKLNSRLTSLEERQVQKPKQAQKKPSISSPPKPPSVKEDGPQNPPPRRKVFL